jgi:hypothetical protein
VTATGLTLIERHHHGGLTARMDIGRRGAMPII